MHMFMYSTEYFRARDEVTALEKFLRRRSCKSDQWTYESPPVHPVPPTHAESLLRPRSQDDKIDAAKHQVQGQLAAQYIQDVMQVRARRRMCFCTAPSLSTRVHVCAAQKITDKCFTRCGAKPGAKLDDYEKKCTAMCMDRYLDAMALVS